MKDLKLFYLLLFGQGISLLGTTLTNFGLGVWAFQSVGRVSDFSFILVASTVPGVLVAPFVGAWIDRWPRKKVLLAAQFGMMLSAFLLAALYWLGLLNVWLIVLIVPFASMFGITLQIALTSSVVLVVPNESLGRVNGILGLVFGAIQLLGPATAGLALDTVGIQGIFIFDLVTYGIGLLSIMIATLPAVPNKDSDSKKRSTFKELGEALDYIKTKPGIFGGLVLFLLVWFNVSAVQALFMPLVLSVGTATDLGFIQSMGGLGIVIGSLIMIAWKGPKRNILLMLSAAVAISLVLIVLPLFTSLTVLAVGAFVVMMIAPLAGVSSKTLWQRKTSPAFQGRVFALRSSAMAAVQPLAFIVAGFLADNIFEPMMIEGAYLAEHFGSVWGTGDGRGVALLISCFGAIGLVLNLIAWSKNSIRRSDIELPDYVDGVAVPAK